MPSEKLRIAHVFRAPLGGLFRHVIDLASEQAARGHDIGLFFDSGARSERVDQAIARIPGGPRLGVATCAISRDPGLGDIAAFSRFSAWLRQIRPDVVHGHGSKGGVLARMSAFARVPGNPIRAYTPHGGSFNYRRGAASHSVFMLAERLMAYQTDVFLFESAHIRDQFDHYVGVKRGVQRVVVNGLSEAEFTPAKADADAADLLYVGELRAAKGIDTLLNALTLIKQRRGAAPSAVLVGSGPDHAMLVQRAAELGLADRVSFPGPLPIRQAFGLGRVLVVPSRAESLPYVVLECAAARLPLVATNVGGIPEIFGPYRDRLGPCDDPENLARRLLDQLDMPAAESAARADELARFVQDHFSVHEMASAALASYREALSRRGSSTAAAVAPAPTVS